MSEWLKEPVSKTGVLFAGTAGSNPALSVWVGREHARRAATIRGFDTPKVSREANPALSGIFHFRVKNTEQLSGSKVKVEQ